MMDTPRWRGPITERRATIVWCLSAMALALLLVGCQGAGTLNSIASNILNTKNIESIKKGYAAVSKTFEDFTPEQEYYIGRTVGAVVLQRYQPLDDRAANRYINRIGQMLARVSDTPETFGGYHFLILDSDEINAFAAPGGLIFVTRGILRCCESEDAVAAVLAHEIGHVQYKHGLQAIKKSRITSAITTLGIEGAKAFGGKRLSQLASTFEDAISDVTGTLIHSGYSRAFERAADTAAVTILQRVGYDPHSLVEMLEVMEKRLKPGGLDFARTHPSPRSRINTVLEDIDRDETVSTKQARRERFHRYLASI